MIHLFTYSDALYNIPLSYTTSNISLQNAAFQFNISCANYNPTTFALQGPSVLHVIRFEVYSQERNFLHTI